MSGFLSNSFNRKRDNERHLDSLRFPGTASKYVVQFSDVSKSFGSIDAVKSVNLAVGRGEILFITGASGAGKTTLLNLMVGDVAPDEGEVVFNFRNDHVGQVFQDLRLMNKESCLDNLWVSYDTSLYRTKASFKQELMELAKAFGVSDRLNVKIRNANGGLKQKVAIIRALLAKPTVLVADEPTSSLDLDNAKKLFDILNYYNTKFGMTLVWASHNKELVSRFSGRIVHMDKGKLVYSGHACFI